MERTLWVIGLLALFALCIWLMYRGWQNRAARQTDRIGELPDDLAALAHQVADDLVQASPR